MRKLLVIVVVSLSLLAAGCGDDSGDSDKPTVQGGGPAVSLAGKTNDHGTKEATDGMEVELDDFYFEPTFLFAKPGQSFTIKLHNEGSVAHTFTVESLAIDTEVAAGKTAEVRVTVPQSGTTVMFCRFHQGQGMQGSLVVR